MELYNNTLCSSITLYKNNRGYKTYQDYGKMKIKHKNTRSFVLLEKGFRYNSGKTKNCSSNRHTYN